MVACDINKKWLKIAEKYWLAAGVRNKIDLRVAPAVDTLKGLVVEDQNESFDFVFIDADKDNYLEYYELSLRLLKSGGLIAIDNVLVFGAVVERKETSDIFTTTEIQTVKALNEKIKSDQRVELSMLQIADGVILVRKK